MLEHFHKYILENSLGDYASLAGLVISVIGFGFTIYAIYRSKSAIVKASEAVDKVRKDLRKMETVADFSSALTAMDEIKRLHRQKAFDLLPDRYANLRKSLISIRISNSSLSESDSTSIQGAISVFASLERRIDELLQTTDSKPNISKMNSAVSTQIDKLQEVLNRIRFQIGV